MSANSHEVVDLVKTYMFAGFPDMAGRIAVRSFDPPKNLSGEEELDGLKPGASLDYLLSFEKRVYDDILDQIPSGFRRKAREALADISGASKSLKSQGSWSRGAFLESSLSKMPQCIPIILPGEKRKGLGTFYYVLNYPHRLTSAEIFKIEHGHELDHELPRGFKRSTKIMTIAHEFAHVALNEFYPDLGGMDEQMTQQKHETICDIVSFACDYALEGERALPNMDLFVEARLKTAHLDAVHNTAAALEEAMHNDLGMLRTMKAREAFEYAEDLCLRLNIG
jgi:hypothetical protein